MKLDAEVSRPVEEYLARVEKFLRSRDPSARREILEALRRHVADYQAGVAATHQD